ncbi:MAG: aspartate/glutamate racemase family protein [Trueperaceae bacterium]
MRGEVKKLLVINPNSNKEVTRGIDAALDPLRATGGCIDVVGLEGTPRGIESQLDVDTVSVPLANEVRAQRESYDAFVVACFSDPGLHGAREVTPKPVIGIAAAGLLTALNLGNSVGVISILAASIPRHWRMYRAMGISERLAGDIPVGASVAELADDSSMGERMLAVGKRLVAQEGADVLVLGCAGMARYREPLERRLGVTVVDPTQAAVSTALGAALLGYRTL